jgi:hypothetical protein
VHTQLIIIDSLLAPILESAGLRRYEDFVGAKRGELVAHSRTTETRRLTLNHRGAARMFYLKLHRYGSERRRPWFTRDKASLEAENYRLLRDHCGIATPEVVAFGSRRHGPWLQDAFILTLAVADANADAVPLDDYVRRRCLGGTSEVLARRRQLLARTADLVAAMHAAGFIHLDLQWRNVLVQEADPGAPRIYLLDCPRGGCRPSSLRLWHGRLRDLSSLYKLARTLLSRAEQIRWLRRYLGVRRLGPIDRVLVQAILYDRGVKDNGAET